MEYVTSYAVSYAVLFIAAALFLPSLVVMGTAATHHKHGKVDSWTAEYARMSEAGFLTGLALAIFAAILRFQYGL